MAAVFESYGKTTMTTVSSGSPNLVVPKPTGLSVGDEMLAFVGGYHTGAFSVSCATPSGWTLVSDTGSVSARWRVYFFTKTADSSDVAASDFTFVWGTGGTNPAAGVICRISAFDGIDKTNKAASNSITNALVNLSGVYDINIFAAFGFSSSKSGYAYATDNPTWTEQFDDNGGTGHSFALATATRSSLADSGTASFTESIGAACTVVSLLSVINGSDTAPDVSVDTFIQQFFDYPEINVSFDGATEEAAYQTNTKWTEQTKESTTWTDKNI